MASDAPPDPFVEPVAFGQRMQILRTRRGMSRTVLAGLLGKSPSWVKQVEGGRLQMPKLPMVLRIAEALRVRDLSELTGDQSRAIALFTGPGHARLPHVRAALNAFPWPRGARRRRRSTSASASSAPGPPGTPHRTTATPSGP